MAHVNLINRLNACPQGNPGWRIYEDICIEILTFLFVPPLTPPRVQPRTISGVQRRDAIFPNRNFQTHNVWAHLFLELGARLVLFEFKNFSNKSRVGITQINQVNNYLSNPMGRLGIIVCPQPPSKNALRRRNTIYTENKKVILLLSNEDLIEMINRKARNEDPADLIMDKVELFYIQHE